MATENPTTPNPSEEAQKQWFKGALLPATALAHAFGDLHKRGVVPQEMRSAMLQHADNEIDSIPLQISGAAYAMWNASLGDTAIGHEELSDAALGIHTLAESLHGWIELQKCLNDRHV